MIKNLKMWNDRIVHQQSILVMILNMVLDESELFLFCCFVFVGSDTMKKKKKEDYPSWKSQFFFTAIVIMDLTTLIEVSSINRVFQCIFIARIFSTEVHYSWLPPTKFLFPHQRLIFPTK